MTSSGQQNDDVKAMGRASEAPSAPDRLPCVTKRKSTPERRSQFGFVAGGVQKNQSRSSRVRQKWEALQREVRLGGRDVAQ
jgi:hypothetical protein